MLINYIKCITKGFTFTRLLWNKMNTKIETKILRRRLIIYSKIWQYLGYFARVQQCTLIRRQYTGISN